MSTLMRSSAIPDTGPAPTNRTPFVLAAASRMDARGEEIAAKIAHPGVAQQSGQDLPTFTVPKENIIDVLRALKEHPDLRFTLPLDVWVATIPYAETRAYVASVLLNTARYLEQREAPKSAFSLPLTLPSPVLDSRLAELY